jgi:hypothetical protein
LNARTFRAAAVLALIGFASLFGGRVRNAGAGSPTTYADKDEVRACAGLTPCFLTIQAAVNNAGGPDDATVTVFPGTYDESVNLDSMASASNHTLANITLQTADATGAAAPGTATIHGPAPISTTQVFPNNITIDGFIIQASQKDGVFLDTSGGITIRHTTVTNPGDGSGGDGDDGFDLTAGGPVAISDSSATGAHGTLGDGFQINGQAGIAMTNVHADNNKGSQDNAGINIPDAQGNVSFENVTADDNTEQGIYLYTTGTVTLSGEANGNGYIGAQLFTEFGTPAAVAEPQGAQTSISIDGFTANDNDDSGLQAQGAADIAVHNAQANNNGNRGLEVLSQASADIANAHVESNSDLGVYIEAENNVTIRALTATDNDAGGVKIVGFGNKLTGVTLNDSLIKDNTGQGVDLFNLDDNSVNNLGSNIVCGNTMGGVRNNGSLITIPAEGVWWGAADGPKATSNPAGHGDKVNQGGDGSFDFTPWITQVIGQEIPAPTAATGAASDIGFTFTDDAHTVAIQNGPGDDLTQSPISVTTDNGTLSFGSESGATVHPRIAAGTLIVTLTPAHTGTAHINLTGPCDLTLNPDVNVGSGFAWGDLDCNGSIGTNDMLRSLEFTAGLTPDAIAGCGVALGNYDLNCSSAADGEDPLLIAFDIAGLQPTFEVGQECPEVGT